LAARHAACSAPVSPPVRIFLSMMADPVMPRIM
jgi:hypothetical protein